MSRPRLVLASQSPARRATLIAAGVDPVVRVSGVDEDAVVEALRRRSEADPSPAQIVCAQAQAKAVEVAGKFAGELNQNQLESPRLARQSSDRVPALADEPALEDSPASSLNPELVGDVFLVVGCDSMLEINGRMVGKPGTADVARERIREMRGTNAVLWTGHSLVALRPSGNSGSGVPRWEAAEPISRAASTIVHFGQISDAEIDAYVATGEPLGVAGSFTIDALGGPFVEGVTGDPHSVVGISLPLLKKLTDHASVFWPDLWASDTLKPTH